MANDAHIDILAVNRTKDGWEDAVRTAITSSKKIEDSVDAAGGDAAGVADKIGHTGEQAAKMAINLLQAFGLSGDKAKALEGILRQVDDGFDALGKAAHLASVANAAYSASNVAVGGTAGVASVAVSGLSAALLANPITAILVGIGAAAAAVAVAFDLWPKSVENVEELNNKLKEHKELVEAILGATKGREAQASALEQLEERAAQKAELKLIAETKSVAAAQTMMQLAAQQQEQAEREKRAHEDKLRLLSDQLAKLHEQNEAQHLTATNSMLGAQNAEEMLRIEEEITKELAAHEDHDKKIANLRAQSEAAQDRAAALPKELAKEKEENDKKELKRKEELAKKEEKFAADRLAAEEAYGDAIEERNAELRKADEEREKAWKEEHEQLKKDIKEGEKLEKFKPSFVGLEELTRGIQLSAMGATKKDRDDAAAKQAAIDTHELLKRCEKVWGDTARADKETATHSKDMAEKIDKLGALA